MDEKNHWNFGESLDLGNYPKGQELHFSGTDSEENYDKNPHPHWAKYSVSYKFNSYGFRSREFEINPGKSIILTFGCSHTVGVGIAQEDNWPEQFGKKYFPDHVVYNAGLGGVSGDTVARLAVNMIPILKPDIVAILWPSIDRFETYHHGKFKNDIEHNGPWYVESYDLLNLVNKKNTLLNTQMKNKLIVNLLQKMYNFKLVELNVDDEFKIRQPGGYLTARDGIHLCGWWHRDVAEDFYSQYLKK